MELIVVMVILGVMIGFALPRVSRGVFQSDTRTGIALLVHAVETERRAAAVLNQDRDLCFRPGSGNVFSHADDNPGEKTPFITLPDTLRVDHVAFSHRRIDPDTDPCIRFHKQGYADGAVIHLSHTDGDQYSLVIRPFLFSTEVVAGHASLDLP
jgi:Tfp pilus assembly protein FimT